MTHRAETSNRVREFRTSSGLTQAELAERAAISRSAVTAIEGERLVPSVATALALAEALGTTVEVLFGQGGKEVHPATWALERPASVRQYWQAEVGGQHWLYPAESGSGARQCLDHLLEGRAAPRRLARNHRGVADAVCSGWADAGICVQLTSAEAGLMFLPVQEEAYDLCIPNAFRDDPRVQALLKVVRSANYRQTLANLPGYSTTQTGNLTGGD